MPSLLLFLALAARDLVSLFQVAVEVTVSVLVSQTAGPPLQERLCPA